MAAEYQITFLDYGFETGTFAVRGTDVTDVNFVAQEGLKDALLAAVQGVSLGAVVGTAWIAERTQNPSVPPADPFAQRESKWLVQATDDVTGRAVRIEIPCADLSLLDTNGETMDTSAPEYSALKSAIEDYALSIAGNSITVNRVIFVARNL